MTPPVGTAWAAVVAHCNKLTQAADAYYVNKRGLRRAAKVAKDLRFHEPQGFFKRK